MLVVQGLVWQCRPASVAVSVALPNPLLSSSEFRCCWITLVAEVHFVAERGEVETPSRLFEEFISVLGVS